MRKFNYDIEDEIDELYSLTSAQQALLKKEVREEQKREKEYKRKITSNPYMLPD